MLRRLMASVHEPIYRHRLKVLTEYIVPSLRAGDRVMDVGCGAGTLGQAILEHPSCPEGVVVEGLERAVRGGEPIVVHEYEGGTMPLADKSQDVVIVADVLHHERDPMRLLRECVRVSRRLVIIKDHRTEGAFSQARVALMDWAANAPYGVPCLYKYNSLKAWYRVPAELNVRAEREVTSMDLYPEPWNAIFGGQLQYMAYLRTDDMPGAKR